MLLSQVLANSFAISINTNPHPNDGTSDGNPVRQARTTGTEYCTQEASSNKARELVHDLAKLSNTNFPYVMHHCFVVKLASSNQS